MLCHEEKTEAQRRSHGWLIVADPELLIAVTLKSPHRVQSFQESFPSSPSFLPLAVLEEFSKCIVKKGFSKYRICKPVETTIRRGLR
jgi:hypothetical protein